MYKKICNKLFNKYILFIMLTVMSISSILFFYNIAKFTGNIKVDTTGIIPTITLYLDRSNNKIDEIIDTEKPLTIKNNTNNIIRLTIYASTGLDVAPYVEGYIGGTNYSFDNNILTINPECKECKNINQDSISIYLKSNDDYVIYTEGIDKLSTKNIDFNIVKQKAQEQLVEIEKGCEKDNSYDCSNTNDLYLEGV